MAEEVRFTAVVEPTDAGAYVVLPPAVVAALGVRARTSVRGTIDGQPFANQVMPYTFEDVGRQFVIGLNKAVRASLRKDAGDTVELVIVRDARSRSADVALPAELAEAIAANDEARARFDALAPSHRREHADYVAEARREETRQRRAKQTIDRLLGR